MRFTLQAGFHKLLVQARVSHRKFVHDRYRGAVTLSGKDGADAKSYQEQQVKQAIKETEQ